MQLYTFIANYEGGTYISQVTAPDSTAAISYWAKNLQVKAIPGLSKKSRKKIAKKVRRDAEECHGHVPLDGLRNAWCFDVLVKNKYMLINFVKTESA